MTQGILDVGMTQEDHVELVKTHTFLRKYATGKAKIELHVLQVERGMSWEQAVEKNDEVASTDDEGFWLSHQVRNGKKTAILAIQTEETGKKSKKGKEGKDSSKVFMVYRPNTGQQVKQETLAELKKKYKKVKPISLNLQKGFLYLLLQVSPDDCEEHWTKQFDSSAKTCSHAFWKGNCRNKTIGIECEVGLRKKSYNVLTGQ